MAVTGRQIVGGGAAAAGTALVLALVLIKGFEGRVDHVYADPVTHGAPWTYCDGETQHPQWGHQYTDAECDAETLALARKVDADILVCMKLAAPLPAKVEAAFVSLAWNIGTGAFCKSSIATKAHEGNLLEACKRIDLYNRAAGRVIPGLVLRRGKERDYCIQGALDALDG